jgi:hypothetical protein
MAKRSTRVVALVVLFLSASFAQAAPADFTKRLQEADRLARLTNWYAALPIYIGVEKEAATAATGATRQRTAGGCALNPSDCGQGVQGEARGVAL